MTTLPLWSLLGKPGTVLLLACLMALAAAPAEAGGLSGGVVPDAAHAGR